MVSPNDRSATVTYRGYETNVRIKRCMSKRLINLISSNGLTENKIDCGINCNEIQEC